MPDAAVLKRMWRLAIAISNGRHEVAQIARWRSKDWWTSTPWSRNRPKHTRAGPRRRWEDMLHAYDPHWLDSICQADRIDIRIAEEDFCQTNTPAPRGRTNWLDVILLQNEQEPPEEAAV